MPSLNLTFPALGDGETPEMWLRRRLHEVTALLNRPDEEHIFAESPRGLRGYTKRIKHPIDLSLIGEKCQAYCCVDELEWDMALMCQNCVDYNGAATKWAKYANTLLADTKEALAPLRDAYAAIAADNPAPAEVLRAAAAANLAAHPMYAKLKSTSLLCEEDTEEPREAARSPQKKSPQKRSPQKKAASPQRSPAASPESTARVDRDGSAQVRLMPVLAQHLRAEAQRSQAESEALEADPKGRYATASPIASRAHTIDDVLKAFREQFLPARGYLHEAESRAYAVFTAELQDHLTTHTTDFLYPCEAGWHRELEKVMHGGKPQWSSVYGVDVLVRLLVRLPNICVRTDPALQASMLLAAEELLMFIAANWARFTQIARRPNPMGLVA
eukprot:Rhum_TRINITY_DN23393_c0_g1::Rhum_TRINITY_DN23393_c0_g1_i1::g.177641::m.177641